MKIIPDLSGILVQLYLIPLQKFFQIKNNSSMRNKLFLLFFTASFSSLSLNIFAQADYVFTPSSGTFTELSGGTDINVIEDDDELSAGLPINFNFEYGGVNYTHLKASSNGFLNLDTSKTGTRLTNDLDNVGEPIIAPLWDDLDGRASGSKASYLTSGTSPNRVFTIEWLKWEWNYGASAEVVSFQVKLYETTNKIEFIYRPETSMPNSPTASIGVTGTSTGVGTFLSLNGTGATPTASSTVETLNLSTAPDSGRTYAFTEPTCKAPGNIRDSLTTGISNYVVFDSKTGSGKTVLYEYGAPGFVPGTGTTLTDTTDAKGAYKLINGLRSSTVYDIYIRIICSGTDTSKPAKYTFSTTYSNPQKIIFTNFTGANLGAVQSGWSESTGTPIPQGSTSTWTNSNAAQTTALGKATARINLYTNTHEEWLISPKILIKSTDSIKFTAAVTDWNSGATASMGSDDSLKIMVSNNGGTTWNNIGAIVSSTSINNSLSDFKYPLGAYAGSSVIVGFLAQDGPTDNTEDYDMHIGEIFIGTPPLKEMVLVDVIDPQEGSCGLDSMKFQVVIKNDGARTQTNFPVYVKVSGAVNTTISSMVASSTAGTTDTISIGNISLKNGGSISFNAFTALTGDENLQNDTMKFSAITIAATPSNPTVPSRVSICSGTDSTIIAKSSSIGFRWFKANSSIVASKDSTFKFVNITKPDTAFVETFSFSRSLFGPSSNSIGTGGTYTSFTDGLVFSASSKFTLDSVTVYPGSSGNVVIRLLNASNQVLQTKTVSVNGTSSGEEIGVGFVINPGNGYKLDASGSSVSNLYRNTTGAVYPYTNNTGAVSITQTINNLAGYYYFFYNWKITSEGCPSERSMVIVDTLPSPQFNLGPDTIFCKGVVNYTMDATTANSTYLWSNSSTSATFTATNQGSYTCKVTDNTGCSARDTVNISAYPVPFINFPNVVNQCTNSDTLRLRFATPVGGIYGGPSVSNGILDPAQGTLGQNIITYAYTDNNSCVTIDTAFYDLFQSPTVTFSGTLKICENDTSFELTGGAPTGGVYKGSSIVSNVFNPANSTLGSQIFTYTYTDNNGCSDSTTSQLLVVATPNVLLSPLGFWCINGGKRILTEGTPTGGNYFGSNVDTSNFNPEAAGLGNHAVFYTFTNTDNCSDTVTNNIEIEDFPKFDITGDTVGCGPNEAPVLKTTISGMTYLWSNGETGDSTKMKQNGIAWVKVTDPTTQAGCFSRDSINVSYEDICVGIMEHSGIEISTYPNPASDYVRISFKGIHNSTPVDIRIISSTGQLVKNETQTVHAALSEMRLDVRGIAMGTYSLLININGEQVNSQLIITK